jgi:carboxyl-terminal processing protease
MKYRLLTAIVFYFNANIMAQSPSVTMTDSVRTFLNNSLNIIQYNAIDRDSVNWEVLRDSIYKKANGAVTYEDVLPLYPYIFEKINDHHGALKFKGKSYYWKTPVSYKNVAVINAIKRYDTVIVKLLKPGIGYILLPGNNDFDAKGIDKDGQAIRDAITAVDNKHVKGWIIDLRVNTGGNMYQMLAGLGFLLEEGKVGSFVNQNNKPDGEWTIRNGNIYIDSNQVSHIIAKKRRRSNIPLAVLISSQTASAGEVVAISIAGQKNTIFIGEETAGYTTANQGFKINAVAGLNLAVDFDADRNGKVYRYKVSPDIRIMGGDNFEQLDQDLKIIAASEWLFSRR